MNKINTLSLLLGCLILLTTTACPLDQEGATTLPQSKQLLIIGIDNSKTFSHFEKIPPQYIRTLCDSVAATGNGGVIAVYGIGNPSDSAFIRKRILPLKPIDENAMLSIQVEQTKANEKINTLNEKAINEIVEQYTNAIYSRGDQLETDFQRFINKAITVANEPNYTDYKRHIFIYSDALHDIKGNKTMILPSDEKLEDIHFYGCGLKNQALVDKLGIQIYESPDGFLESFTNHIIKQK